MKMQNEPKRTKIVRNYPSHMPGQHCFAMHATYPGNQRISNEQDAPDYSRISNRWAVGQADRRNVRCTSTIDLLPRRAIR